jgi:hypothetical protein
MCARQTSVKTTIVVAILSPVFDGRVGCTIRNVIIHAFHIFYIVFRAVSHDVQLFIIIVFKSIVALQRINIRLVLVCGLANSFTVIGCLSTCIFV